MNIKQLRKLIHEEVEKALDEASPLDAVLASDRTGAEGHGWSGSAADQATVLEIINDWFDTWQGNVVEAGFEPLTPSELNDIAEWFMSAKPNAVYVIEEHLRHSFEIKRDASLALASALYDLVSDGAVTVCDRCSDDDRVEKVQDPSDGATPGSMVNLCRGCRRELGA